MVWDLQFNIYLASIYYLTFDEAKAVVFKINSIFWNKNHIYFDGFLAQNKLDVNSKVLDCNIDKVFYLSISPAIIFKLPKAKIASPI